MRRHCKPWPLGGGWPRPALDLDLRRLDNRVMHTRGSNGTYRDGAGVLRTAANNIARHDHDLVTGAALGLLIEGTRTQLAAKTETFNAAEWTKTTWASLISSNNIAPDGAADAELWEFDQTQGSQTIRDQSIPVAINTTYQVTAWVKAGTNAPTVLRARMIADSSGMLYGGATWTKMDGSAFNPRTEATDWIRVKAPEFTTDGLDTILTSFQPFEVQADGGPNSNAQLYLWGVQLEAGSFPSSYIANTGTTGTSVTRAADDVRVTDMAWLDETRGAFFAEWSVLGLHGTIQKVFSISEAAASDGFGIRRVGSATDFYVVESGAQTGDIDSAANWVADTVHKAAVAFGLNDFAAAFDGEAIGTDTTVPVLPGPLTELVLGNSRDATRPLFGHLRRFRYWPRRMPNPMIERLAS